MLNDPTFLGWLTTGMYIAAATLCVFASHARSTGGSRPMRDARRLAWFWLTLAFALLALAVNKQLDVQTSLTNTLRDAAQRDGWYAGRRIIQVAFVILAALVAAALVWVVRRWLGPRWREHRLVLIGIALEIGFLLLRIADIERVGEITGLPLAASGIRCAFEWAGLLLIAIAARRIAIAATPSGEKQSRG